MIKGAGCKKTRSCLEELRWEMVVLGLCGGMEVGRNGGFVIWGLVTGYPDTGQGGGMALGCLVYG